MTGAIAKASWSSKRYEATDVVHQTHQKQNDGCDQQRVVGHRSGQWMAREKIGEEQLIERERERVQIELTMTTFVTGGTQTDDVLVVASLQTATLGFASIALPDRVIVVEAFNA